MSGDPRLDDDSPRTASAERLDSWKEIAAYLRRDVTTVQRWEKRESMPVHRHLHDKLGSVFAFPSELDAWARSRSKDEHRAVERESKEESTQDPAASPSAPRPSRRASWPWTTAAGTALLLLAVSFYYVGRRSDYFWRSPIETAQLQHLTDFDGIAQAAAISRDGRFVAFQSDRDGRMDVWVTQTGTGRSYNLTRGRVPELVNPSVRTLGFSPDGAMVTFWVRRTDATGASGIGEWAIPVLGGDAQLYLDGVAEFDWSGDASRLVYHTTGAGDPTFIRDSVRRSGDRLIYTAAAGRHAHFPTWSPDQRYIYFVEGEIPGGMDIWRMRADGGAPERITRHNSQVSHPVLLNARTLLYLATDTDGAGPWLYGIDVENRIAHRIASGLDAYTSLAASADGSRVVLTVANPKRTLWRTPLAGDPVDAPSGAPVALTTARGSAPRFGAGSVLYVSSIGGKSTIWKLIDGRRARSGAHRNRVSSAVRNWTPMAAAPHSRSSRTVRHRCM